MELKSIGQKKNPFFNREEVVYECNSEITPSKKDLQQKIGEKISIPESQITITKVDARFGNKKFIIYAYGYHSAEEKQKIEFKPVKKKKEKKKKK